MLALCTGHLLLQHQHPALSSELRGSCGQSLQHRLGTTLSFLWAALVKKETVVMGCPGAWQHSFPKQVFSWLSPAEILGPAQAETSTTPLRVPAALARP